MRVVFVVLVCVLFVAALTTRARPRTRRDWTLVWAVLVFLAWALLGFGWLRSAPARPAGKTSAPLVRFFRLNQRGSVVRKGLVADRDDVRRLARHIMAAAPVPSSTTVAGSGIGSTSASASANIRSPCGLDSIHAKPPANPAIMKNLELNIVQSECADDGRRFDNGCGLEQTDGLGSGSDGHAEDD
jgi:hypothetical protein